MTTPIRFGTDGWRAIIAGEYTYANLERVAQAYSDYLLQSARCPLVVIGYDRRFMSGEFAHLVGEVLTGNNVRLAMFREDVPTPLISWAVKELEAAGGIVITASHNPANFNGFKIKAPWGGSAPPETTREVERLVDAHPVQRSTFLVDGNELLDLTVASYRKQISSYVDLERMQNSEGFIVVDPMHGTGGRWVESFLNGKTLNVETIRGDRDPLFGGVNPEPIDRNLDALKRRVVKRKALLGLATDGDADRVGAVNELGETMNMHQVVPLILFHLVRERRMTGGVVRTFSQSVLLKRIASAHDLKLYETPIGFKYIADLMLNDDILIGAEESGGIGVKGHIPERDGILNSLLFLEAVVTSGLPPSKMLRRLHEEFGEFYFGRKDLRVEPGPGQQLVESLAAQPPGEVAGYHVTGVETMDGTKLLFEDESWLLFRQSGTEPVLRIYSEATSVAKVDALLNAGEALAR